MSAEEKDPRAVGYAKFEEVMTRARSSGQHSTPFLASVIDYLFARLWTHERGERPGKLLGRELRPQAQPQVQRSIVRSAASGPPRQADPVVAVLSFHEPAGTEAPFGTCPPWRP